MQLPGLPVYYILYTSRLLAVVFARSCRPNNSHVLTARGRNVPTDAPLDRAALMAPLSSEMYGGWILIWMAGKRSRRQRLPFIVVTDRQCWKYFKYGYLKCYSKSPIKRSHFIFRSNFCYNCRDIFIIFKLVTSHMLCIKCCTGIVQLSLAVQPLYLVKSITTRNRNPHAGGLRKRMYFEKECVMAL